MDPALLGLPLAPPSRRGVALLVDLVIVGLLTAAGGVVLGLLAGVLFLRAAVAKKEREKASSSGPIAVASLAFRSSVGCLGGFILFVTIVSVWGGLTVRSANDRANRTPAEVELMLEEMRADLDTLGVPRAPVTRSRPEPTGIRGFLRGIAEDLGLGFGWAALYFTVWLTMWKGRTPGKWLLGLRVVRLDGASIGWWSAFERYGGYAAGFATGLLGFLQVYWDPNRQATHDKISGTVVILEGRAPPGEPSAGPANTGEPSAGRAPPGEPSAGRANTGTA